MCCDERARLDNHDNLHYFERARREALTKISLFKAEKFRPHLVEIHENKTIPRRGCFLGRSFACWPSARRFRPRAPRRRRPSPRPPPRVPDVSHLASSPARFVARPSRTTRGRRPLLAGGALLASSSRESLERLRRRHEHLRRPLPRGVVPALFIRMIPQRRSSIRARHLRVGRPYFPRVETQRAEILRSSVVVAVSRRLFRRARSPRRRRLFRASSPRRLARLRLRSPCGTRVVRGRRAPARRTVEHHLRVEGIAVEVRHAERGTPRGAAIAARDANRTVHRVDVRLVEDESLPRGSAGARRGGGDARRASGGFGGGGGFEGGGGATRRDRLATGRVRGRVATASRAHGAVGTRRESRRRVAKRGARRRRRREPRDVERRGPVRVRRNRRRRSRRREGSGGPRVQLPRRANAWHRASGGHARHGPRARPSSSSSPTRSSTSARTNFSKLAAFNTRPPPSDAVVAPSPSGRETARFLANRRLRVGFASTRRRRSHCSRSHRSAHSSTSTSEASESEEESRAEERMPFAASSSSSSSDEDEDEDEDEERMTNEGFAVDGSGGDRGVSFGGFDRDSVSDGRLVVHPPGSPSATSFSSAASFSSATSSASSDASSSVNVALSSDAATFRRAAATRAVASSRRNAATVRANAVLRASSAAISHRNVSRRTPRSPPSSSFVVPSPSGSSPSFVVPFPSASASASSFATTSLVMVERLVFHSAPLSAPREHLE